MPTPPAAKPVIDEPVQGVRPANTNNLSVARRPASLAKEPTVYPTRAEVEAMFKKETYHSAEVAAKPYPTGYRVPKFYKF